MDVVLTFDDGYRGHLAIARYLAKRGIYYFTLNLLKHVKLEDNNISIIQHPLTKYSGLNDVIRIQYNIIKFPIKGVNLIFIPHARTFSHAAGLYIKSQLMLLFMMRIFFLHSHVLCIS